MIAKIEIYNDSGDLVSKYEAPPYKKRIDIDKDGDYEVRKYDFRFMYAEYVPIWQKGARNEQTTTKSIGADKAIL
jgi:hypothetical protein